MKYSLVQIQTQLEKRLPYHYQWQQRRHNTWIAVGIAQIFTTLEGVNNAKNKKDFKKDLHLNGVKFDLKTSVFAKKFTKNFLYALQHKKELIAWFYNHQSKQKRDHVKNRRSVVVHAVAKSCWKLNAKLRVLKIEMTKYVNNYGPSQLQSLIFANNEMVQ